MGLKPEWISQNTLIGRVIFGGYIESGAHTHILLVANQPGTDSLCVLGGRVCPGLVANSVYVFQSNRATNNTYVSMYTYPTGQVL